MDAWAPGLGSLAGPAEAAKGIQGLWAGFGGRAQEGPHGRDEGGGRGSRGVGGSTWNLLEAPPPGDGPASRDPPRWSSGCRRVLTGTHASYTDAEKRPQGPHPKGSREPTASAGAGPALVGCVKALQPGSGALACVSIARGTPHVTPASSRPCSAHAHARHTPGSHAFPCRALLRSRAHRTRPLPQETQAPPRTHVPHLRTAHVHPALSYLGPRGSHCFPQKEKLCGVPVAARSQGWAGRGDPS